MRSARRPDEVLGLATCAEREEQIALTCQCVYLAGEHVVVAVVVAERGEDGGIRGERDRRKGPSLAPEAADQLSGEVLCLGGAASVPRREDHPAGSQRRDHEGRYAGERIDRSAQRHEDLVQVLTA